MSDNLRRDSQNQIGGPTDEEQALVDQEQRELMERLRKEREPAEIAERQAFQAKMEKAMAAASERRSFEKRLELAEARLTVLEANK